MTASEVALPVPARRRPRGRYVVVAVLCAAAIGWILYQGLGQNLVYLRTVSEAVERRDAEGAKRFRMAGAVVPGSIVSRDEPSGAPQVTFRLTDGKATVRAVHLGDTPDLFADDAPVVCEGRWQGADFDCDRILIRHGNEYSEKYRPPKVSIPGEATTP
jgi:cytochrome c-type biogenesis protein CcmE